MSKLVLSLALFGLVACATSTDQVFSPEDFEGEMIGIEIEPRPVVQFATVDADPSSYFNQTLLVEANAVAICQKAGCWMQVEDEGRKAMVRWETGCGGKYKFPVGAAGKRVLIQGSFYPKEISEADIEHIQEEAGQKIELEREGYEFNASAVILLESETN